jgi:hypothetical protein
MKKQLLFLTVFALGGIHLNAQKLKDLKNKVTGKESTTEVNTTTAPVQSGGSQYETAEAFLASGTKYASIRYPNSDNGFANSEKVLATEFFRALVRNADNKIVEFHNSLGNGKFVPNEVAYPMYYYCKDGGMTPYIYFLDGFAIGTKESFSSIEEVEKASCGMWEIYCPDKAKLKGLMECGKVKALLTAHVGAAKQGVDAVREQEKAAADKLEAEKRAKYTTKGKLVTKIRIESTTKIMEQGKTYGYNVIATLKDGSEISTANGGYIDEYEVSATGLPATYVSGFGEMNTVSGLTITVPMENIVTGDKVVLTVKSKNHPTLISTQSYVMSYMELVTLDYDGDLDMNGNARHGGSLRIEIKSVAHGTTGEKLLEYKVFSKNTGLVLKHFKVSQTSSVNVLTNGRNGKPASIYAAKDGTNGGNSTIVVDPSVKAYTLNITYDAGRGGSGDTKHPINGVAGTKGSVEKLSQKVSW